MQHAVVHRRCGIVADSELVTIPGLQPWKFCHTSIDNCHRYRYILSEGDYALLDYFWYWLPSIALSLALIVCAVPFVRAHAISDIQIFARIIRVPVDPLNHVAKPRDMKRSVWKDIPIFCPAPQRSGTWIIFEADHHFFRFDKVTEFHGCFRPQDAGVNVYVPQIGFGKTGKQDCIGKIKIAVSTNLDGRCVTRILPYWNELPRERRESRPDWIDWRRLRSGLDRLRASLRSGWNRGCSRDADSGDRSKFSFLQNYECTLAALQSLPSQRALPIGYSGRPRFNFDYSF